jgi:co-chaperonin GroES (HSP10)
MTKFNLLGKKIFIQLPIPEEKTESGIIKPTSLLDGSPVESSMNTFDDCLGLVLEVGTEVVGVKPGDLVLTDPTSMYNPPIGHPDTEKMCTFILENQVLAVIEKNK